MDHLGIIIAVILLSAAIEIGPKAYVTAEMWLDAKQGQLMQCEGE